MIDKLNALEQRFEELSAIMSEPFSATMMVAG